ncbi:1-(5-phosphoribosyl)-5-[(5-phosphoribosylamino)methylideneamino]imidazole-4-carboxamide isomerase [soil metagenome]
MLVIPVIDIKDGRTVTKIQGLGQLTNYYCTDPEITARLFRKENFKTLHITDLDGALYGDMKNLELIKHICNSVDIPIQLGGGIRDFETAKTIIEELGVYRIVIGTAALTNRKMIEDIIKNYGASKLVICIDESKNQVMMDGWITSFPISVMDFAKEMSDMGVKRIIYQDINRVGTLQGPNLERIAELALSTKIKITAAGGFRNYKDMYAVKELEKIGVDSILMSRALYENRFPCQQIWRDQERRDASLELPKVK